MRLLQPNRTPSRRRGAALVEIALVLPIFFAVILGIIEFGRAMMVGQLVTNAAREGARLAVVGDSTNAIVTQSIRDFLSQAANISPDLVTVTITVDPFPGNPPVAGNQISGASSRDLVTVTVEVPFSDVSFLPPTYLSQTRLTGRSSMRYE